MTRPIVVVYGNCQAGLFAESFKNFNGATANWDVHYVMSFVHPTEPQHQVMGTDLAQCALVLEQLDNASPLPAWLREKLPADVPFVRFPPIDFNLLWPFNFTDPRNVSEPPDYPFGRFPYGDRIVVELLREGLTDRSLWEAYQERSVARMPDLNRLRGLEAQRLVARDAAVDVMVSDLVLANHRVVPLFWTINHPTGWLLGRVLVRLLHAAQARLGQGLDRDAEARALELFASWEPFGHQHQPIHPEVARRLGLNWWKPERTYLYFDGTRLTFEEFMLRYIRFS
jgi:hypothetical protein